MTRYRVLIADDHATVTTSGLQWRRTMFRRLRRSSRCSRSRQRRHHAAPRCLSSGHLMPGNGLAAAYEITARLPDTQVVMLTGVRR